MADKRGPCLTTVSAGGTTNDRRGLRQTRSCGVEDASVPSQLNRKTVLHAGNLWCQNPNQSGFLSGASTLRSRQHSLHNPRAVASSNPFASVAIPLRTAAQLPRATTGSNLGLWRYRSALASRRREQACRFLLKLRRRYPTSSASTSSHLQNGDVLGRAPAPSLSSARPADARSPDASANASAA